MKISRITLGTVQIGLEYGIANKTGKPAQASALEMLDYAWKNGINSFDTAPAYGNSETIIGTFVSSYLKDIDNLIITSKLPGIPDIESISKDILYERVKNHVNQSLSALKIKNIPVYLLHKPNDLFSSKNTLIECLTRIKNEGLIGKIGVSIYEPWEVELALNYKELEAIQIPINVLDHRLINSGLLDRLKKRNFVVFARSVYLQGLFMLDPENIPKYLEPAKKHIRKLRELCTQYQLDMDALCFLFVRDLPAITSVVIGAEKLGQVERNISLLNQPPIPDLLKKEIMENFKTIPENIVNPSKWNK